nr:MAG TPA: Photosystem II 4 kDa reaction centre component [Caudoviricetes sp.]
MFNGLIMKSFRELPEGYLTSVRSVLPLFTITLAFL